MAIETKPDTGTWAVKTGLAQMLKGGVIMDVVTPEQAIEYGADFLVIGRPITKAKDPLKTIKEINQSINSSAY